MSQDVVWWVHLGRRAARVGHEDSHCRSCWATRHPQAQAPSLVLGIEVLFEDEGVVEEAGEEAAGQGTDPVDAVVLPVRGG